MGEMICPIYHSIRFPGADTQKALTRGCLQDIYLMGAGLIASCYESRSVASGGTRVAFEFTQFALGC